MTPAYSHPDRRSFLSLTLCSHDVHVREVTDLLIAVISALISSIALVGVAISLLLQARQVKISRLQAVRAAQLELMKMALDNPAMAADALGISDPDLYVKQVFLNWHIMYLQLGFEVDVFSPGVIQQTAAGLFEGRAAREWWEWNRRSYGTSPMPRRVKQFFEIVDEEFQRHEAPPNPPSGPPSP